MPVPFFGGRLAVGRVEFTAKCILLDLNPSHPALLNKSEPDTWGCSEETDWPIGDETTQLIFDCAARISHACGITAVENRLRHAINVLAVFGAASMGAPCSLALMRAFATTRRGDTREAHELAKAYREILEVLNVQTRGGCWRPGFKPVRCGDPIPTEQD